MLHRKNKFPLHLFFRFLKEHKVYKQYRQNLGFGQFNISSCAGEDQFVRLVTASFTWSSTPEGHSFWDALHTIWYAYCAPNIIKIESKKEQTQEEFDAVEKFIKAGNIAYHKWKLRKTG